MVCCEAVAPKGADRVQIGPGAAGLGESCPRLELDASVEVPTTECFRPYLTPIPSGGKSVLILTGEVGFEFRAAIRIGWGPGKAPGR